MPADGSTATFTITFYGTLSSSISVLFSTGDGTSPTTDYTPVTDRPITFTSDSKTTTQTTTVDLNQERKNTTNETFLGELGTPQEGSRLHGGRDRRDRSLPRCRGISRCDEPRRAARDSALTDA